jgi:prevent-host-death family protein
MDYSLCKLFPFSNSMARLFIPQARRNIQFRSDALLIRRPLLYEALATPGVPLKRRPFINIGERCRFRVPQLPLTPADFDWHKTVYFNRTLEHEANVKTATAKDLRRKTSALLDEVRRGQTVVITYRGESIAVLIPVKKEQRKTLHPAGFGMWRDRKDMRSVEKWLIKLRQPRYKS